MAAAAAVGAAGCNQNTNSPSNQTPSDPRQTDLAEMGSADEPVNKPVTATPPNPGQEPVTADTELVTAATDHVFAFTHDIGRLEALKKT